MCPPRARAEPSRVEPTRAEASPQARPEPSRADPIADPIREAKLTNTEAQEIDADAK